MHRLRDILELKSEKKNEHYACQKQKKKKPHKNNQKESEKKKREKEKGKKSKENKNHKNEKYYFSIELRRLSSSTFK